MAERETYLIAKLSQKLLFDATLMPGAARAASEIGELYNLHRCVGRALGVSRRKSIFCLVRAVLVCPLADDESYCDQYGDTKYNYPAQAPGSRVGYLLFSPSFP